MRVLVTGATGFAGGWLTDDLRGAGHEVTPLPGSAALDLADREAVRRFVAVHACDVVAHLAAAASNAATVADPAAAIRATLGGTINVLDALAGLDAPPALMIVSSAEVYAAPGADGSPLTEASPVAPRSTYGMLKAAQEAIARDAAGRLGVRLAVLRPFNHVGPRQRTDAAVPSFVARITAINRGEASRLSVGNLDVERDIADVRDVVRAYRLVLEALAEGSLGSPAATFNVATGRSTTLRSVVDELCRLAGVRPEIVVDPSLLRAGDPSRIVGDASALAALGWGPRLALTTTLRDMLDERLATP